MTPSRPARASSPTENEKHSEQHRNNADGVLQNALENNIDCIDGDNANFAQQQRGGSSNEEVANEDLGSNVLATMSSLDGIVTKRGASRKQQHWKSQSVGESMMTTQQHQQLHANSLPTSTTTIAAIATATTTTTTAATTIMTPDDESQEQQQQTTTNFSANRELWQRRATSQPQPTPKSSSFSRTSQEFREMRQKHTPDLVMDLPLSAQDPVGKKSASSSSLSSSDEETMMPSSLLAPQQQAPSRAEAATSPTGGPESPDMSTAAERFAKQNQCTLKKNTKTVNSENATTAGNNKLKRIETTEHDGTGVVVVDTENDEIIRSASSNQIAVDGGGSGGGSGGGGGMPLRSPLPPRSTPKIVAKFADMHLTGGSQVVSPFKPQVKVKPTILRKPVLPFPHPHMSPELARKIEKQAQSAEQAN